MTDIVESLPAPDLMISRLLFAQASAANDDYSKPKTPERKRHTDRLAIMREAIGVINALVADLAKVREESEHWHTEAVHWNAQACDDPGKNPPVFWKDEVARLRADPDAARAALAAERERCAKVATSFATCECGGKFGRCVENDAPFSIAAAIRALPDGG